MGPARGLPVRAAAWRRMTGSLKRFSDPAIRETFGAHLPNSVDNTCIETGDTPCDRRSGLFTVLRAPGPSFCHVIPPTMRRCPGRHRGTTVQTGQDGHVLDRDEQMTHRCQSPWRPFSSLLRACSPRMTKPHPHGLLPVLWLLTSTHLRKWARSIPKQALNARTLNSCKVERRQNVSRGTGERMRILDCWPALSVIDGPGKKT